MTVNLVSQTSKYMTPDLMERLASALGTDRKDVGQAARAAIPALLGSLASLASSRDGAQKIDAAVSQSSPGMLENLAASIGGGGGRGLVEKGMRSLSSLFGSSSVSALGNAVGKFAGIGQSTGSSLIAMLAPMVLGLLGKEKAEKGLDASGIADLLREQKDNIAAAMPAEFKRLLQSSGMPAAAGIAVETAAGEKRRVAEQAARVNRETRTSSRNWLVWLIALLAIVGLALWFFNTRTTQMPASRSTVVGGVELTSTLKTTLDGATSALRSITDVESARAAVPRLKASSAELAGISELAQRLPADGKQALASMAAGARPEIDRLSQQALAVPEVEPVIKPEVDLLRTRLDTLGKM